MTNLELQMATLTLFMGSALFFIIRCGLASFPFLFLMGTAIYLLWIPLIVGDFDYVTGASATPSFRYYATISAYAAFYLIGVRLSAPVAFESRAKLEGRIESKRVDNIGHGVKFGYILFLFVTIALCAYSLIERNIFRQDGEFLFTILGFDLLMVAYLFKRGQRPRFYDMLIFMSLLALFAYAGFRYRIAILIFSELFIYLTSKTKMIFKILTGGLSLFLIIALAMVGQTRVYGSFDTYTRLFAIDVSPLNSVRESGEQTVYFATVNVIERVDSLQLAQFEPLIVLLTHFVPSRFYPNKPRARYLEAYMEVTSGLKGTGAAMHDAGQAALMFGLPAVPITALLLGLIMGTLLRLSLQMSPNINFACALTILFGIFIPSRGYLAQQVTWALSFTLPLVFLRVMDLLDPKAAKLGPGAVGE